MWQNDSHDEESLDNAGVLRDCLEGKAVKPMPEAILQPCPRASRMHHMLAGPWRQLAHCRLLRSSQPKAWLDHRAAWPALLVPRLLCAATAEDTEVAPAAPHARSLEASGQVRRH